MLLTGIFLGFINGRLDQITNTIFDSSKNAVNLSVALLGAISLWSGIINIAEKSDILKNLSRMLEPVINFLFPSIPKDHNARKSIVMNLTANFLGLGNAATPFGIKAMKELQDINTNKNECSYAMSMFLILNSVGFQLIPSTMISIRSSMGAKNPSDIVYVVWIVSIVAVFFAVVLTRLMNKLWR
ncbi:MAG: nucleoside recognition protein [Clostridiales bacterium]|nr:nucleoside recognition protein [Clostridiales bacterium]